MPLVNDPGALVNDSRYLVNDSTLTGATAPTVPPVHLEVAFGSNPLDEPVWTDVSARASDLRIAYGRQQELDAFQPGRIGGPLDNSDRALDKHYAAGPFFGKLRPRRRVRAWTFRGSTHALGSGYVHGWPQSYQHPEMAVTELTATDGFLMLASDELPGSVYELEVASDKPYAWWRLGETEGARALDSSGNRRDGTYVGGATFNTRQGLIFGDDNNGIEFDAARKQSVGILSAAITKLPFAVEFWVQVSPDSKPAEITPIYAHGDGRNTRISMKPDGTISAFLRNSAGQGLSTSVSVADGAPHHVVFRAHGNVQQIFVDGVQRAFLSATLQPPARGPVFIGHAPTFPPFAGTLHEVAVYDYILGFSRIQAHHVAGTKPWDGDTTGERINRVLDLVGWPAAERDIDLGNSTLGPARLARRNVLEYLQLIERTEQGALYIRPDFVLRFRERRKRFYDTRMTTPQWTLTDEDLPGALHYEGDLEPTDDETLIYNEVTVRWDGGEVTVSDQLSIDTYGRKSHSIDTIARTADDARWIAEWVLDHYKEPHTRVSSVTVNPGVDPALWDVALASLIGDRVRLRRHPQGIGDAFTIDAHIEGKEHVIAEQGPQWRTTFPLSVAETKRYWILGSSALGVDTVLGY